MIGVVILARNESKSISKVLKSLLSQSLEPSNIIVVNDGSTDNTRKLVQWLNVDVIDYPELHDTWIITKNLAKVVNFGLDYLPKNLKYYMILGGDHVLDYNYMETVIESMQQHSYSICSGVIDGESGGIRGSGRMMTRELLESQNFHYKVNFGYETYMLFRAEFDGFKIGIEKNAKSHVMRKTGAFYKKRQWIYRGQSYHALGYSFPFILGVGIKSFGLSKKLLWFVHGYRDGPKSCYYEGEIRKFVRHKELKRIINKIKNG
jgi:glycosyltransferase involved in cell wall biosynthesis